MPLDWYVAYTSAAGERKAQSDLEGYGYHVYLPTETVSLRPARHRKDRKRRVVQRPLFPRYLFVGLPSGWYDFDGIRRSPRVRAILSDAYGCPLQIPEQAVTSIMDAVELGRYDEAAIRAEKEAQRLTELSPVVSALRPGMEIRLTQGLFRDFLATVRRVMRKSVLVDVKGERGATFSLEVPHLQLDEDALLSVAG